MIDLFSSKDNTFCNNEKCKKRLTCKRHIFFYKKFENFERLSYIILQDFEVVNCDLYIPVSNVRIECIKARFNSYKQRGLREGQSLINSVQELQPQLIKYVETHDLDCFYDDSKVEDLWKFLRFALGDK